MKTHRLLRLLWIWLILALSMIGSGVLPAAAQSMEGEILTLTLDGALSPAMKQYLERGLRLAGQQRARAVVVELDTPGGSLSLMNDMVEIIRASRTPVIVYVSPRGAMAGSAGTLITLAGHAAAMAPETTIGAASPIDYDGSDLDETLEAKEKNILKATVRSLAERRGPEAVRLAEETIESAKAVSANEALDIGLVDFVAEDLTDLLNQANGFEVQPVGGLQELLTTGAIVRRLQPSFTESLLELLTNSTVVFLLLIIGVQAILIEIASPGGWGAGFIGVVALAMAGYGLEILPVNWFGAVFLVTAFILFVLDIKAPTHGALTLAGIGSLIAGGLILFNSPSVPAFQRVPTPIIIGVSLLSGAVFFGAMMVAVRAQKTPVKTGVENMVGRTGTARSDIDPAGMVQLGGESWSAELAEGETAIVQGERVEVVAVRGLRIIVRKAG